MAFCTPARTPGVAFNGSQSCVNFDKREVKVMLASWKNDLLDGYFWCANDDGIPQLEANYRHGKFHGKYQEYDSSLKDWGLQQDFKSGMREGISRKKLRNGEFMITFYINDKRHGYELIVDAKNQIKQTPRDCSVLGRRSPAEECDRIDIPGFEKAYAAFTAASSKANEARNNRLVETHYADGQIRRRYALVNGQIDGKDARYFQKGNPSAIALYSKGKIVEESVYFEEGQIKQVTFFDHDLEKKQSIYYQNGQLKSERHIIESQSPDLKYAYEEYFDNGQLAQTGVRLGTHIDGVLDGAIKTYLRTGELATLSVYDRGERAGTWKYANDKYHIEDIYKNGKLQTRVIYDKATKLEIKRSEFMPDGSLKSEKTSSLSKI